MIEPSFIEEEIPLINRGSQNAVEWDKILAPIRDKQGTSLRVYTFADQKEARSRAQAIVKRWTSACPLEEIHTATRQLPDGSFGVWVTWIGEIDQARRDELTAASEHRRALIQVARAARAAEEAAAPPVVAAAAPAPAPAPSTAKTTAQRLKEAQAVK